jgi:ribose 5-phosphate isomerase B
MKKIALASDHVGFYLKEPIKDYLIDLGYDVNDIGPFSTESVDYPIYAKKACESIINNKCEFSILFCGTGVGMSMAANKFKSIRAVVCSDVYSAKMSRAHNNSNVLTLGSRVIGIELSKLIVESWINTDYEGGRHQNRVEMIDSF